MYSRDSHSFISQVFTEQLLHLHFSLGSWEYSSEQHHDPSLWSGEKWNQQIHRLLSCIKNWSMDEYSIPLGTHKDRHLAIWRTIYQLIDPFENKPLFYLSQYQPKPELIHSQGSEKAVLPVRMCQFLTIFALRSLNLPFPIFANKSECCWGM